MKVLALVASPRKLGNSEILAKEMLAALPAETEKELVRLTELDVKLCKACYACLPRDKGCVLKDDMAGLLDKIRAADAVIIAAACYFLGPHTSLKLVGDRLLAILANRAEFAGKRCVTAVVYGIEGWEGYSREAVANFARFLHLDLVGGMLVRAASPGEAARPEVLAEARELAARLVVVADEAPASSGVCVCEGCGSSLLQITPSGRVRCVMCEAGGKIVAGDSGVSVVFDKDGHGRFTAAGKDEHVQLLEDIKSDFIANRSEFFRRRKPYEDMAW